MKIPAILSVEDFERHFKDEFWRDIAAATCARHGLAFQNFRRSEYGEHIVFLIDDRFVLKIYRPARNCFRREKKALETARTTLKIPEIIAVGEVEGCPYLVMTQLKGELMPREMWLKLERSEQVFILKQLAEGLRELHREKFENKSWKRFVETQKEAYFARQIEGKVNPAILETLPEYVETNSKLLPENAEAVFLHGDIHFGNLRFSQTRGGRWEISGLFDFADSLFGLNEHDFLAIGVLMIQGQGDLQREFFRAYGYRDSEINETLRRRLMLMTILYECSDLRRYALRLKPEAVDFTLDELERAIWNFD